MRFPDSSLNRSEINDVIMWLLGYSELHNWSNDVQRGIKITREHLLARINELDSEQNEKSGKIDHGNRRP